MTIRRYAIAGFAALFLGLAVPLAEAQSNVALVIGNGAYQNAKALPTTIADAASMAETLRAAGYDVTEMRDVLQRDNGQIVNNFLNKIAGADGKVTAFLYYAGYAAQVDGDNYLVPVDATIADAKDIRDQSLRLGQLLEESAKIPAVARVIVLDASYEHGFARDAAPAVPPGLAIMQAPAGMAIASAAAPGEVATAEAGSYTRTLVALMRQPGLELDQIFKTARSQVNQATAGKQTPWSATGLMTDVVLMPAPIVAPPAQAVTLPVEPPVASRSVIPPVAGPLPAAATSASVSPAAEAPAARRPAAEAPHKKDQRRQAERPRRERAVRENSAPARQDAAPPPAMLGIGGIGIGRRGIGIGIGIGP